ncbi:hypothetical protein LTR35_003635 [Friedmanniomyces endolithicus]|nr:hypothetical protein LTR35_003635 [Friedmanniomyces endolithicus]KAK0976211.1 hypothetical protein LTR54_016567 [Friedmanniomyces endolithicus]
MASHLHPDAVTANNHHLKQKRARSQLSCSLCRVGKLRCNREKPHCDQCLKRNRVGQCLYVPPPAKHKPVQNVKGRIRQLEELVVDLMNKNQLEMDPKKARHNGGQGERHESVTSHDQPTPPSDNDTSLHFSASTERSQQSGPEEQTPPSPDEIDAAATPFGKMRISKNEISYVGDSHWNAILNSISDLKRDLGDDDDDEDDGIPASNENPLGRSNTNRTAGWGPSTNRENMDSVAATSGLGFMLGSTQAVTKEELIAGVPEKKVADRLLSQWFNSPDPFKITIHAPTFQEEYKRFWRSPKDTPTMWLGLLFAIMSLAESFGLRDVDPASPQAIKVLNVLRRRCSQILPSRESTVNTFGPDEYDPPLGTGAINKEYGAVIVIRFVCHLPKAENERLAFHKNFQIVVGDSDTFESISHEINKDLEAAEETKRLFRVEYRDSWQLHLWAMPHAPAPRTLFRFEPSGSDGPSLVKRFMSLRMLKRKHGGSKLYMEAHLWEVDDDEDAKLVRHHAETGTEHASGPRDSDVHEDSWLEGSGPSQQGSRRGAATKKPGFARSGGAKMSDSSQPQERGGISVIPRDQLEDVSDQASSATEGEDLCYAAAREQSRLLFEDEQLRLAIELSEREMLEGLPPDESLSWNALSGEDTSDLGEDAADRSSEVYEDGSGGGGGDRDSDAQDLETQDEDEDEDHDSPESRHGVDHSKAARVESEQRSSENSGPEQEKASQADVCDGNDGEAGEDIEADDESSWLIHVPASLREEQRRQ